MTGWHYALICYLAVGAVFGTALTLLDRGTRGSGSALQGRDIVVWLGLTVVWLPFLVGLLLRFALFILLPMRRG